MIWSRGIRERVREFVTACTGGDWPGRRDQARRLLEALPGEAAGVSAPVVGRAAPAGRVDKSALPFAPPRHPSREDRREERNARMAELRRRVLARAGGRCEFMCFPVGEPVHAHHVFGGADRRSLEAETNLAALCDECHKRVHAEPAWARHACRDWALRMRGAALRRKDAEAAAAFLAVSAVLESRITIAEAQARTPGGTT